jgi:PAS domain S-box-containing protein
MRKMLIVDDNQQNLYMLQVLFSANGFQVELASNGADALERAQRDPPDIIISDILMPVMDGFSLCRAWKKNDQLKNIPFVFYTATYTDPKDEAFALSLGADRFVVKPLEPDNFLALIGETIEKCETTRPSTASQPAEEAEYYKEYNAALIRKLEEKMLQLEETNRLLEGDIVERERIEAILRESESKYRALIENIPQKILAKDRNSVYVSCNRNYVRDLNATPDEIVGKTDYDLFPRELAERYRADDKKVMESGQTEELEESNTVNEVESWIRTIKTPIRDDKNDVVGVLGISWDITERKQAEEERRKLEDHMIRAQKMESIGRLAGGIAHDFNNMLGVILGCADLALLQLDQTHPLHPHIREIYTAAQRSAELTRQLLAFARRQPVSQKVLDLNDTMEGMLRMLQRLIGENIELVWNPGAELWRVKIDPSQVDQILANLCINARDAIAGEGQVAIETENVVFDSASCKPLEGVAPGEYVKLSVRDSGCGMDRETLSRLFEPFFTTKAMGKGTGLGLATVYGVVKQNEGHINVLSEPDHGSTFEIYFPRYTDPSERDRGPDQAVSAAHGQETVLLVEDEPQLMELIRQMLESLGYQVFSAVTPGSAIRLAEEHAGEIHLLITDLVMPEMNGIDLSKHIQKHHPLVRSLFMSGYPTGGLGTWGLLDEGVHFLQKPYSINELAGKIREVLDQEPAEGR